MTGVGIVFPYLLSLISVSIATVSVGKGDPKDIVEVLIWSGGTWAGFMHGEYFPTPNYLGHAVNKAEWKCPVDCRYTGDKTRLGLVDAVIFEAQPITSYYDDYKRGPPQFPQKYPHQYWINHGYETQYYFHLYGDPGYLSYIDINFTYYLNSQVPLTFTCLWGGVGSNVSHFLEPHPPKTKERGIVFMTTNCWSGGAIYRTAYMHELMKHVKIDSYGQCLHNKDMPEDMRFPIYSDHGASMRNKITVFSKYKFVIAFENNNVTDYVTEKMPNVFQAGSVPIYMGSANVDPYWIPGENSIVEARKFKGPKDLAKHLQFLLDNDDEYEKKFEWKKKGLSDHFKQRFSDCAFYGAECRLCQYLHAKRKNYTAEQTQTFDDRRGRQHGYHAISLNGDNQHIEVPADPDLNLKDEFTFSAWISPKDFNEPIIDRGGVYTFRLKKVWKRAYLELCFAGKCWLGSQRIPSLNNWYHVVAVFKYGAESTGHVKFWVNGVLDEGIDVPEVSAQDSHYSANPKLFIGTTADQTAHFGGVLDDVAIWRVALSDKDAKAALFAVYAGNEPGLVAYYSFNESPSKTVKSWTGKHDGETQGAPNWPESLTKPLVSVNPCL
eukprot:TRINITY_DN3615_c0_g1_i1.p1 TRINITY_DN3615_c0_g1~~TRINITY_DN3615_c0_g1_i1.p1  ORF type:complete len:606 (+),score=163.98 TRINITY_DN3615_c0_g1_i1:99-1916(+)